MYVLINLVRTLFVKSPIHLAPLVDECQDDYNYCDLPPVNWLLRTLCG